MDSSGIIYFKYPSNYHHHMMFVASRISLKRVSGPKKVFFDFVGKFREMTIV